MPVPKSPRKLALPSRELHVPPKQLFIVRGGRVTLHPVPPFMPRKPSAAEIKARKQQEHFVRTHIKKLRSQGVKGHAHLRKLVASNEIYKRLAK